VLVVSAWEPWRLTDATVWILHHHLRHLAPRHEITVFAAGARAVESSCAAGGGTLPEQVHCRWFGTRRPRAVDYALRRVQSEMRREPSQVCWVERPALLRAVREHVETQRPDVVYAFGWGTAGLWRHAGDAVVVNNAVDSWDLNYAVRRLPWWRRATDAGQRRKVRRYERQNYPRLARTLVVAEPDAVHLRALAPEAHVGVVPNGVEPGEPPSPPPAQDVLGFHGFFEATHNVSAAMTLVREILPLVRERVPTATVRLIGRRPPRALRSFAGPDVDVRADVPSVRPELDRVAVYVAPMSSGSGMKNKVLEAMAAGRVVVTNPLGAAGIGAGPGVIVCGSVTEMADEVVALLQDRPRLEAEGAAGRRRVERDFSWAAGARALEAVWEDVVRR
jgi:glycosyltransferase involved in cell wall biosynthesis